MKIRELDNLQQKLERLKLLSALSGYGNCAGAKRAVEIAMASPGSKWSGKVEKFFGSQVNIPLDMIHPFIPEPSSQEVGTGDIILGYLQDGTEVRLPLELLAQGLFIVGTTGSGKTWLLAHLCRQFIAHGIKVWWFDRENEAHNYFAEEIRTGKAIALSYKDLRRNLLQAANEEPKEAINRIASIWRGSLYLRDGSANMLSKIVHDLYEKRGVLDSKENYPSLHSLHDCLSKMTFRGFYSRQAQYWETLINRTTQLVTQMGDVYDCSKGFDIQELLDHSIIWRLMGLSTFLHQFFVEDLMSFAISYRERTSMSNLTNCFVVDEAHRMLSSNTERNDLAEPFIYQVARTTRKRGFGLVMADQIACEIPSSIIGNMNTRIVLRLFNGPCIKTIGASMSLDQEQMKYLPELPMRTAVIHSLIHPKPFLIHIPELNFNETLGEDELKQLCEKGSSMFKSVHEPIQETKLQAPLVESQSTGPALSQETINYLTAIATNPFLPVTECDRKLKVSLRKGHEFRDKLESEGYIKVHKINTGNRSGLISVVEITDKAYEYLKAANVEVSKPSGIGGFLHCYWQHQIRKWYLAKYKDCKAIIEDTTFGKRVDVGIHFPKTNTAIEILIEGEQKELSNISKDLEHYKQVICCCQDTSTLKSLKERVEAELGYDRLKKIWFKLLGDFYIIDASPSPSATGSADVETEAENQFGFPKPE